MSLEKTLEQSLPETISAVNETFVSDIKSNLARKGLADNENDTKPGQPDLADSFKLRRNTRTNWTVLSDAPHAVAHEEGTKSGSGYSIEPDQQEVLSWIPENVGTYPTREEVAVTEDGYVPSGTWYDPEDGRIYSTGVEHPGVSRQRYIRSAQSTWSRNMHVTLRNNIANQIMAAGFRVSE
jgi:hypothetical protein